jgi:hypothetical protein
MNRHTPLQSNAPVHVEFTSDGFHSTGISYDDYKGMSLMKRKAVTERRLPTPEWALNDTKLRDVMVAFIETRAGFRKLQNGTPQVRLSNANKRRLANKPRLVETLTKLCRDYAALKKSGKDPERLKQLGIEIESFDTQLRFLGKEDEMVAGVVYRYYRLKDNSVEVAAALGMKPPHVRQVLWRLDKAARAVAGTVRVSMYINMLRGLALDSKRVLEKGQRQCWMCGTLFTPIRKTHKCCTPKCRRARDRKKSKHRRKDQRAAKRFFCSEICKATGWNIKKTMLLLKPGVGKFVPPPGGDSYNTYEAYCKVAGTEPMTREQYALGLQ